MESAEDVEDVEDVGGVDVVASAHLYPMNETSRRLQLFQFQQNNMLLNGVELSISTVFRHRIAVEVGPGGLQILEPFP